MANEEAEFARVFPLARAPRRHEPILPVTQKEPRHEFLSRDD
jgi:hypothetical protein